MTQMSQVFRERAIGMRTAGMPNRAVATDFNVNFSTTSNAVLENLAVCPTGLTTADHVFIYLVNL
jgi:hypothetical protein